MISKEQRKKFCPIITGTDSAINQSELLIVRLNFDKIYMYVCKLLFVCFCSSVTDKKCCEIVKPVNTFRIDIIIVIIQYFLFCSGF